MRRAKFSAFGATVVAFFLLPACSGVDDYPIVNHGGAPASNAGGATSNGNGGTTGSNGGTQGFGGFVLGSGGTTTSSGSGGTTASGGITGSGGTTTTTASGGAAKGGSPSTGGTSASSGGSAGTGSVSFSQISTLLNQRCGSCHLTGSTAPDFSVSGASLYSTLTSRSVSRCASQKLVIANDTTNSALIMVTTGKCGTLRMPNGCTTSPGACLTSADATTLSNWISQGAKGP
ncbi:MAG: hypothetical protein QM756_06610 [Polyangiaceae bacterium]